MIPIISLAGLRIGQIVGYALIVEQIFCWPGIGQALVTAVLRRDYPVAQFFSLILVVLVVLGNWLADTGYTLPSAQTITSQSPTSFVSTGGNPSWNSSTGVLGLEFTSQTISSADKAISLNLANGGTAVD